MYYNDNIEGAQRTEAAYFNCGGFNPCFSIDFSNCCTRKRAMSNSCFTFHRCVSQMGSLHRWCRSISCASKTAPLNVNDFPTN